MVSMLAIQLLELVWNTKGAMKVNGRMPYPASVNSGSPPPRLESPKRLQQQQQAGIQNSSGRVALRRPVRGCYPPSRD